MTVDYDLVIIGETLEAREAAAIATQEGARVALVLAPDRLQASLQQDLLAQVLTHWGHRSQPTWPDSEFGAGSPTRTPDWDWPMLRRANEMAAAMAHPHLAPEALARQGVDVVPAAGYFSPKPRLAFTTENRILTARAYLLACGSHSPIPAIPGLAEVPYLTLETLLSLESQPPTLVILGRSAAAIALAQTFATLGTQVTLITRSECLLPAEDADVSQFIETLLVAAGVNLQLKAQVARVQAQADKIAIHLANGELTLGHHCLIATRPQPALADLNLERVGVEPSWVEPWVNDRLQTRNPRIYAAGSVLGDNRHGAIARHEVQIAVHNALYLPTRSVHPTTLPYSLGTTPELGRVGLSETQAQQRYGAAIQVFTSAVSTSVKAHLLEAPLGFCKVIALPNGRLVGACLIGPQASDLVQALALLMAQNSRLQTLATFPAIPHTLTELLTQTAQPWQQRRWQHGRWRRDWSENWFNWRRSRRR